MIEVNGEGVTDRAPRTLPARASRRVASRWAVIAGVGVAAVVVAGVSGYLLSPASDVAPDPALRQLDLLYLDEPAPALDALGVRAGRPAVVVFCDDGCEVPKVTGAHVLRSGDADLAAQYALLTAEGRVGPGYALVDADGQLRYRTFDPAPGQHATEVQVLVDALVAAQP